MVVWQVLGRQKGEVNPLYLDRDNYRYWGLEASLRSLAFIKLLGLLTRSFTFSLLKDESLVSELLRGGSWEEHGMLGSSVLKWDGNGRSKRADARALCPLLSHTDMAPADTWWILTEWKGQVIADDIGKKKASTGMFRTLEFRQQNGQTYAYIIKLWDFFLEFYLDSCNIIHSLCNIIIKRKY